jgi:SanA protein
VVASGDNRTAAYNEPAALEEALAEAGVPPSNVIRDGGGVGTLQSMRRARDIYGLERFIVVSQRFHNERAVYLASHMGLDVVGYNAADVTGTTALRTNVREYFARVKALVDARFRLR